MFCIQNETHLSLSKGMPTALVLLDLLAAFDTIDHDTLLACLSTRFGFTGTVIRWFTTYLLDRIQSVNIGSSTSQCFKLNFGVPQGSVLCPLLKGGEVYSCYSNKVSHWLEWSWKQFPVSLQSWTLNGNCPVVYSEWNTLVISKGMPTALVLLDLLAAFHTIDHDTLLTCLSKRFGFTGTVLRWFTTYPLDDCQSINIGSGISQCFKLIYLYLRALFLVICSPCTPS